MAEGEVGGGGGGGGGECEGEHTCIYTLSVVVYFYMAEL